MEQKKKISTRELINQLKTLRKRPLTPEFIEKFNQIIGMDENSASDQDSMTDEHKKKIAHPPEASI